MKGRIFILVLLALLLIGFGLQYFPRLRAADENYTHIVESKPVALNGLEFVIATEDVWYGGAQIQLLIHNTTSRPMIFPAFDTFSLFIEDASGKRLTGFGERTLTFFTKPVIVDAGRTYSLSRYGHLRLNGGPPQPFPKFEADAWIFLFEDGTGSEGFYGPIPPGKYAVGFHVERNGNQPLRDSFGKELHPTIPQWSGDVTTKTVPFEVLGP